MMRRADQCAKDRVSDRRRILKNFGLAVTVASLSPKWLLAADEDVKLDIATENKVATNLSNSSTSGPKSLKNIALPADPANQVQGQLTSLDEARQIIATAKNHFTGVKDYVCTFVKQERIGNTLLEPQTIQMKGRTDPHCIYISLQTVHKGREAIYHPARFANKLIAHEGGWKGYLAGTMHLDPTGRLAMSDNRHPVTEAGLNKLINRVYDNWHQHLQPEHDISIERGVSFGERSTTVVSTKHDTRQPQFHYHLVKLYFDEDMKVPVRFVGYDWPRKKGESPLVLEDYQFRNLRLNVGLSDRDFDPKNPAYSYK